MWASADECRRRERFSIQHVVGTCGQNSPTAGGPRADFYTRGLSQGPISRTLRAQVASPACSGLAFLDQTWIHFSYLIYHPADLRGRAPVTSIDDNKALVRGFYDGSPFLARGTGSDRRRSPWASPSYRQRSRTGRHGADKIELVARIRLPVGAELPIAPQRRLNERVTASSSRPKSVLSSRVSRAQGHARRSIGRHSQRRTGPEPASRAAQAAIGV